MTSGPFLYDDEPEALHTGTGRSRRGLIVALLAGTVLVAIGMVIAMVALRGTDEEQATEVAGVFLAALSQDDVQTAVELLCEQERLDRAPEDLADEYLRATPGEVGSVTDDEIDGEPVQRVEVRWAEGSASEWALVRERGPRVCGVL